MSNSDDVTVTIDGVVADRIDDDPRTFTRGTTISPTLTFSPYQDLTLAEPDARFDALAEYVEYNTEGILYAGTTDEGEPWFREDVPEFHPVESYLVDIEYGEDNDRDRSAWGIITDGADVSPSSMTPIRQLELDLFVLAELDEYVDKAAVRDAFEATLFP